MLKKTITYDGFDEDTYTEDFYFHMSRTELTKYLAKFPEGLDNRLRNILNAKDLHGFLEFMDELILNAYGKKSADGKRFVKTPESTKEFMDSNAYDTLFTELYEDPNKLVDFVYAIVDKKLAAQMKETEDQLKIESTPQA